MKKFSIVICLILSIAVGSAHAKVYTLSQANNSHQKYKTLQNKGLPAGFIFGSGFECDDGYFLNFATGVCEDINECNAGQAPGCSTTQICSNTIGSYTCDDCISGHQNNGIDNTCIDINECSSGTHNCSSPGGVCANSDPGLPLGSPSGIAFTCECYPGYTDATCASDTSCTVFVDRDNNGTSDGETWVTAYTHFDDLPPIIGTSCDIWVAEGIYSANSSNPVFNMYTGVDAYGGFNATESNLIDRDWLTNITYINGDATANHVVSMADNTRLDGFVIEQGDATGVGLEANGAGVLFDSVSSSTLANSTIDSNYATGSGGGLYINSSTDITVINTTIQNNFADVNAGGLWIEGSNNVEINNSRLFSNYAQNGGGIYAIESTLNINTTVFQNNNATNQGEALYNNNSTTDIFHTTITDGATNSGILLHNSSNLGSLSIDNSVAWNMQSSPLIPVTGDLSNVAITNSIIYDPTIMYPISNISSKPYFINWPNDLHLYSNSPAIDIAVTGNANILMTCLD